MGEFTIMFTDLRDFTGLTERLSSDEGFRFLNEYLDRMSPIIQGEGGFIDKFIGDAIMALFPEEPDGALRAGVRMLRELEKNGAAEMGAGIHTGNVMLGTVGSESRMDTTVIGDSVNLASRMEGLTKLYGSPLLITDACHSKLAKPRDFHIRLLDRVRVKGKSLATSVYEVFDTDPPMQIAAKLETRDLYRKGYESYSRGDFREAEEIFADCCRLCPGDVAAIVLWNRCLRLLKSPPSEDWEGVTIIGTK